MYSVNEAEKLITEYIKNKFNDDQITYDRNNIKNLPNGWRFYVNSKDFFKTRNRESLLYGPGTLFFNKETGEIISEGTLLNKDSLEGLHDPEKIPLMGTYTKHLLSFLFLLIGYVIIKIYDVSYTYFENYGSLIKESIRYFFIIVFILSIVSYLTHTFYLKNDNKIIFYIKLVILPIYIFHCCLT